MKDRDCASPQVLQFQAVEWGPNPGEIRVLPPLPGDSVGFALANNDRGMAVGSSGSCADTMIGSFAIGPHAVMWDHGSPLALGSCETGMIDAGAVDTDRTAFPGMINDASQVVGTSCDTNAGGNCRAHIWQYLGPDSQIPPLADLNSLIPEDSPYYLISANAINDAGQIVGMAVDKRTGETHAYLANPVAALGSSPLGPAAITAWRMPENVRRLIRTGSGPLYRPR